MDIIYQNKELSKNIIRLDKKYSDLDNLIPNDVVDIYDFIDCIDIQYINHGECGIIFLCRPSNTSEIYVMKYCPDHGNNYGNNDDIMKPNNVEIIIMNLLFTNFEDSDKIYFIKPIMSFQVDMLESIELLFKFIPKQVKQKYNDMFNYKPNTNASIIIMEYCEDGTIYEWLLENHDTISTREWSTILFHILYTLAIIQQKYPSFRHNDLRLQNVLIKSYDSDITHTINGYKFSPYNIGVIPKICDFDWCTILDLVDNNKIPDDSDNMYHISSQENKYYDMHYFINIFVFMVKSAGIHVPKEIIQFAKRVIPKKYKIIYDRQEKNYQRIDVDEFTTPLNVICNDPLFENIRTIC